MSTSNTLLADTFDRINQEVHVVLEGLTEDQLTARIGPDANTIAWLIWHLARIQDDHIADVAGNGQVWISGGWFDTFALPFDAEAHGWGFTTEQVGAVKGIEASQLAGYLDDVHQQTIAFVGGLTEADLERIVDTRWDPPVTMAARLVSVISDNLQHVGQAALIRGLV